MKTSTIMIIALVGIIAYLAFRPTDAERRQLEAESEAADATPPSEATPPPETPIPTLQSQFLRPAAPISISRQALVVVRGTVVSVTSEGMVVECEEPPKGWRPASGTLDNPKAAEKAAKEAEEEERRQWGNLIMMEHGSIRKSDWEPAERAAGRFLLKDHPFQYRLAKGDRVKIVAAPLDEMYTNGALTLRAYTANFAIIPGSAETGGSWMWQRNQGTMLDH